MPRTQKTPQNDSANGLALKRSGGQPNNRNALRHGMRSGLLPRDARYIQNRLNAFRRQLEDQLIANKGEVTLVDAALIVTVLRWERHRCQAQRWLRLKQAELSPTELLTFSREIARASTERDRALVALKID